MAGRQGFQLEWRKGSRNQGRRVDGKPVQNSILQAIPEPEFLALKPHLRFEEFEISDYLQRLSGKPHNRYLFPD
jgi:hypothetical protein